MATAVVNIYNMALGQAGIDTAVALPSESSYEAETCTLYYNLVRQQAFCAAHWPCARAAFRLPTLASKGDSTSWAQGDPEPGWKYAYGLPSDYLHARYLSTYGLFQMSAYTNSSGAVSKALVTNEQYPVLVYSRDITDPSLWDPTFTLAVSAALGAFVSRHITGKSTKYKELVELADRLISQARSIVANSEEYNSERLPEWVEARGSAYRPVQQQTYVWPYGPLFQEQATVNT